MDNANEFVSVRVVCFLVSRIECPEVEYVVYAVKPPVLYCFILWMIMGISCVQPIYGT